MTCEITDVELRGLDLDGSGLPTRYAVVFRIKDCKTVRVTVSTQTGSLVWEDLSVDATQGTIIGDKVEIEVPFAIGEQFACGTELTVSIRCNEDPQCRFDDTLTIECEECPDVIEIVVEGPSGRVNQADPCIPPGDYTVTVTTPVGPTVIYSWTLNPPGSAPNPITGPANSITVTIPPGAPAFSHSVFVTATQGACAPLSTGFLFLETNAEDCPETITTAVMQGGATLTPTSAIPHQTHADLSAGTYLVRVTDPTGAAGYDFTVGSGAPTQSGTSNEFQVTLAEGDTVTITISMDAGPCCGRLFDTVTLTVPLPDNDDDDDDQDDDDNDDEDDDDDDGNETSFSLCGALAVVAIVALLAALIMGSLIACGVPIPPVAIAVAVAVSAAALLLLALICRWNFCRIFGAIAWTFMWGALIGAVIAIFCLSLIVAFVAVAYAIIAGLLVVWLGRRNCPIPQPFAWP